MHKYIKYTLILFAASTLVVSCNEDDPIEVQPGIVNFHFEHMVDDVPLMLNSVIYTNSAQNIYGVTTLKYYISNVTLIKSDGEKYQPRNYNLIDLGLGDVDFRIIDVPPGDYTSVSFSVGVDPTANSSGDQQGALDPINGMFWTWNTGYIFSKFEGKYLNGQGDPTNFLFHIGLDANRIDKTVPINFSIDSEKAERTIKVNVNVNKFFNGVAEYDLLVDGDQSETMNFPARAEKMRKNMAATFNLSLTN